MLGVVLRPLKRQLREEGGAASVEWLLLSFVAVIAAGVVVAIAEDGVTQQGVSVGESIVVDDAFVTQQPVEIERDNGGTWEGMAAPAVPAPPDRMRLANAEEKPQQIKGLEIPTAAAKTIEAVPRGAGGVGR